MIFARRKPVILILDKYLLRRDNWDSSRVGIGDTSVASLPVKCNPPLARPVAIRPFIQGVPSMYHRLRNLTVFFVTVLFAATAGGESSGDGAGIPFLAALEAAAILQEGSLDDPVHHALLLGNGDINALLYGPRGEIVLRLTKNDVWDDRIDTSRDGPLLKVDIRNHRWTGGNRGDKFSHHGNPFPCDVAFGLVRLGSAAPGVWRPIRRAVRNAWGFADATATMLVEGQVGASNGYGCDLLLPAGGYRRLRLRLSGTGNAEFFVSLRDAEGVEVVRSGWQTAPAGEEARVFELPAGATPMRLELYARTKGGAAEIRYREITFEGETGPRHSLDLTRVGAAVEDRARLDLRSAVAEIEAGDDTPPTIVRALADRNAFLIHSPRAASLEPVVPHHLPPPEEGVTDGVSWLHQPLPGDVDYAGMDFSVALAEAGPRKAVAIVTSKEANDSLGAAIDLARQTLALDDAVLIRQHEAVWSEFWSASGVDLSDEILRDAWYRNLYFLRCVSKPGVQAAGLYAGLVSTTPAWAGRYTLDYNTQQTFWGAFINNHIELAEPYVRLISDYMPRARWLAREIYDCKGAFFPANIYGTEPIPPEQCTSVNRRQIAYIPYHHALCMTGWAAQNLWLHYQYQPDIAYLEKTAYPVLKEVATFYADFMDRCRVDGQGKIVLGPSYSTEHGYFGVYNVPSDIAFARLAFQMAGEAAGILGRDPDQVSRWEACMKRLPDYPVSGNVVVDWVDRPSDLNRNIPDDPFVYNPELSTHCRPAEPDTINHNIAVPTLPVFPAGVVNWLSPEPEQALFRRTIETLRWDGYNSAVMLAAARARLDVPDAVTWMRQAIANRLRPNGTVSLLPHDRNGIFTETFAWSGVIAECLMQSEGGVVRLFPAWPQEKDAGFRDLRAQGGFLVSAELKGAQLAKLEVVSTAGGKLRVLSPWKRASLLCPETGAPSATLEADPRGMITFDTRPGERIVLMESPPD